MNFNNLARQGEGKSGKCRLRCWYLYSEKGAFVDWSTSTEFPDAKEIWNQKDLLDRYPLLSIAAQDILAIPASSAPVERVFSTAGVATSGRSGRLSGENLETKVLLQRNRLYLDLFE